MLLWRNVAHLVVVAWMKVLTRDEVEHNDGVSGVCIHG